MTIHLVFPQNNIVLQINEFAIPGTRFGLESAVDADVGSNSSPELPTEL